MSQIKQQKKHQQPNSKTLLQLKTKISKAKRIAFLGIGHPLRGDDAAGLLFVRYLLKNLQTKFPSITPKPALFQEIKLSKNKSLLFIEGGASPENYTGVLRTFKPDLLVIIDAGDLKAPAGTLKIVPQTKISSFYSISTHKMPPNLLVKYLLLENPKLSTTWLIIQPKKIGLLSQKVSRNVQTVIKIYTSTLASLFEKHI